MDKIKTINGIKYKLFKREELIEKLNMTNEEADIVENYQVKFPQLLQVDKNGFCIDGETLCKELGIGSNFNDWLLGNRKGREGKLIKYRCIENTDFEVNREIAKNSKGGRPTEEFKLTLELAKELCMTIGITPALNKETKELSKLCRKYFITIEKTLKNYEKWNEVREPEKLQANLLKDSIRRYCERNGGFDDTRYKVMKCKEFNMINEFYRVYI